MEFFNESIFLFSTYHMMFYASSWALHDRDGFGWSLIICIVVMIVFNYSIILYFTFRDLKHKVKMRIFRKEKTKILKEREEVIQ